MVRTMRYPVGRVAARPAGGGELKLLPVVSALAIALAGCGSPPTLNVAAYDACAARHPQEIAICEGPRQAYELDPTAFEARATAVSPPADINYAKRPTVAGPALAAEPLPPNLVASGRLAGGSD